MGRKNVIKRLEPIFEQINSQLATNLVSDVPFVSQVCQYILLSGGKRIRPALFILSARLCGYQGRQDYYFSTIFEYLHAATLLHDDVVDDSDAKPPMSFTEIRGWFWWETFFYPKPLPWPWK
jgi:octaprenyl-diphosphate synthase